MTIVRISHLPVVLHVEDIVIDTDMLSVDRCTQDYSGWFCETKLKSSITHHDGRCRKMCLSKCVPMF